MANRKKEVSPWVTKKRPKSINRRKTKPKKITDETKKALAESDKGSWFKQEKWAETDGKEAEGASSRKFSENSVDNGARLGTTEFMELCQQAGEDQEDESDYDCEEGSEKEFVFPTHLNIIDPGELDAALAKATLCQDCKKSGVEILESSKSRHGLAAKWILRCKNKQCRSFKYPTKFNTGKKQNKMFELNRAAVLAFRAIGKGFAAAKKFCSILNLPRPVHKAPWSSHTQVIDGAASDLLENELVNAALKAKEALVKAGDIEACSSAELQDKICDLGVTVDGSWSSRGWSARDGVVATISVITGQVLDVVYLTSTCSLCNMMEGKRRREEISKKDFLAWYIKHEESCYLNHNGSASAMEAAGAVRLYERSESRRKLRYIPYVGDGDSKAYTSVVKAQPYGPAVYIPKEECINHVTKRMGTNLRALVNKYKGKKIGDRTGIGGRGRLTNDRIAAFTNFYGKNLKDNKGGAKAMGRATKAILKHYSSTLANPMHDDCPKGTNSWCSYQVDLAQPDKPPKHVPIQDPLPPEVYEVVEPVFAKLGNEAFLAGCEKCLTQNPNESLHHVIWGLAPKEQYTSAQETHLAVCLGVMLFNNGMKKTYSDLMPNCGLTVKQTMVSVWEHIDLVRKQEANYKEKSETKQRRKENKRVKSKKQDGFKHQEGGPQYKSQGFYQSSSPRKPSKSHCAGNPKSKRKAAVKKKPSSSKKAKKQSNVAGQLKMADLQGLIG